MLFSDDWQRAGALEIPNIIMLFYFISWAPSTTFLGALNIEGEYNSGWQMEAC